MREEEIRRYEQMLAEDPDSRAFAPLAEAYRKAGNLDKALAVAQTGLRIHPDYVGGLVVAGRILLEKGDYKKAHDSLSRAVKDAPENLIAQKSMAKTSIALGDFETAGQALKAAMLLSPDDEEIVALLDRVEQESAKASKAPGQAYDAVPDMEIEEMVSPGGGDLQDVGSLSGEPEGEMEAAELTLGQPGDMSTGAPDLPPLSDDLGLSEEPGSQGPEQGASPEITLPQESQEIPVDFEPFPTPEDLPVEPQIPGEQGVSGTDQLQDQMASASRVQEDLSGDPEIATETLADIYADQGEPEKAAQIYKQLLDGDPADGEVASKLDGLDDPVAEQTPSGAPPLSEEKEKAVENEQRDENDPVKTLEFWLENVERMRQK